MDKKVIPSTLLELVGEQYTASDNRQDKSGFRRKARLHESVCRAENGLNYGRYGNYLTVEDALEGANFYDKEVADYAALRYPNRPYSVFGNMLRSEHIPFNLFVPLIKDKDLCEKVMNKLLGGIIESVVDVKIEYAPGDVIKNGKDKKSNKAAYLNDKTSFDTYIEYIHRDGTKGALGIEVKFTEHEYVLKKTLKEGKEVISLTADSVYYRKTVESGLYKQQYVDEMLEGKSAQEKMLVKDLFRQMWRNHILGTSMKSQDGFSHFTSVLFYPKDNEHFDKIAVPQYKELLNDPNDFVGITYEQFICALEECCVKCEERGRYEGWIEYLKKRYLVKEWVTL